MNTLSDILLPMTVIKEIKESGHQVFLIALISFFSLYKPYAQTSSAAHSFTSSINGYVFDSTTQGVLSGVTVVLQETGNSQHVQSTITSKKGSFTLRWLLNKSYQLTFSSVGYKATTIQLYAIHASSVNVGSIGLAPMIGQLGEIQVATRKPIVEQDADKLTYHVEADPESKTATAFEILSKIPTLSFDADDNLQLNGNGNYRLLINGKTSSLFVQNQSDALKYFSASVIQAIEVIAVPGAKYAAEGVGGIINIITYKEMAGGYNGGMSLRVSSPRSLSTNGNIRTDFGKVSLSGNAGYNITVSPVNSNTSNRQDKIRQDRLEQTGTFNNRMAFQTMGSEIRYEPNSYNLITVGYNSNKNNSKNNFREDVMLFSALSRPAEVYNRLNTSKSNQYGYDVSLDYQRSSQKNEAQQLAFSYKRSNNTNGNSTDFILQPLMSYNASANITTNDDRFSEQSFRADYVQPLKKQTLELGISYNMRINTSDYSYKFQDPTLGTFVTDTSQSNIFRYREDISAAYASLNLKLSKWGLIFGTRLERANIDAHFVSSGTFAKQDYINLIPTVTLSRKLMGFSLLKLSYTQRIDRPHLNYLNPYVDFTDRWNIGYGNPGLQPALAHVFNLGYNTAIKKIFFNIALFHQFTNNSIQQFTTLGTDTISRTTFGNIGGNKNYTLSLSGNTILFKLFTLNLNGNASYMQYTRTASNKPVRNEGFTYHISGSVAFRHKSWRVSSNVGYNAPNVLLQGKSAGFFSNSISLNKQFLKNNKAAVSLQVNSPFQERRHLYTEINDPSFYLLRESFTVIRRFSLSLNYRFGKMKGGK